jgi:hypothetical protein
VCQRDCTAHFPQLFVFSNKEKTSEGIKEALDMFFHHSEPPLSPSTTTASTSASTSASTLLLDRFPDENVVCDVYVEAAVRRSVGGEERRRVWVLDLNVWGKQTDSLLFDWDLPPLALPAQPVQSVGVEYEQSSSSSSSSLPPQTPLEECAAASRVEKEKEEEAERPTVVSAHFETAPSPPPAFDGDEGEGEFELRLVGAGGDDVEGSSGGRVGVRSSPFSEYRAPIEMHHFAQGLLGGGGGGGGDGSAMMGDFTKFMEECERKDKKGAASSPSSSDEEGEAERKPTATRAGGTDKQDTGAHGLCLF